MSDLISMTCFDANTALFELQAIANLLLQFPGFYCPAADALLFSFWV
ncbi:MAG: hypothetical protein ABUS47_11850 [Steroidobacter sp.]